MSGLEGLGFDVFSGEGPKEDFASNQSWFSQNISLWVTLFVVTDMVEFSISTLKRKKFKLSLSISSVLLEDVQCKPSAKSGLNCLKVKASKRESLHNHSPHSTNLNCPLRTRCG